MSTNKTIGAYERKFLEMLLRHELPDQCEINIEVKARGRDEVGRAMFALNGDSIEVKSKLGEQLRLKRFISSGPACW